METAYDILFFWVARMIMDGLEFTGQVPFETVYLHGLIRDENGQKMSKSKGTGIDPLPVMEEFGTDALRFTLLVGSTPGNDTNLSLKKVEGNRNFANKIWNAGRFVISAISTLQEVGIQGTDNQVTWTLADSWIWARLQALVREVERLFQSYQYGEAGRQIYEFFWNDFADWYVEVAKIQMQKVEIREQTVVTLVRVLDMCLRLLHPITPFVTEELWGHLRKAILASPLKELAADWTEALIVAAWPEPRPEEEWEKDALKIFQATTQETVRTIRNLRAEKKIKPDFKLEGVVLASGIYYDELQDQADYISGLTGTSPIPGLRVVESFDSVSEDDINLVTDSAIEIKIPMKGIVNLEEERTRLQKELADIQIQTERLEKLLDSDFASKAPAAVVQKERERLVAFLEAAEKLNVQLKG